MNSFRRLYGDLDTKLFNPFVKSISRGVPTNADIRGLRPKLEHSFPRVPDHTGSNVDQVSNLRFWFGRSSIGPTESGLVIGTDVMQYVSRCICSRAILRNEF